MQNQSPKSRVVGVGKTVDEGVETVAARVGVFDAGGGDEVWIEVEGEEGGGEVAEEGFEDGGDAVDVVEEGGGVAEVDGFGVCIVTR